jgi:Nuclear transport factor 2 (NTF2) domain
MLTFETTAVQGAQNIMDKLQVRLSPAQLALDNLTNLQNLPFKKVQHQVATLDAQPSTGEGGILVLVTGALMVSTFMLCFRI